MRSQIAQYLIIQLQLQPNLDLGALLRRINASLKMAKSGSIPQTSKKKRTALNLEMLPGSEITQLPKLFRGVPGNDPSGKEGADPTPLIP